MKSIDGASAPKKVRARARAAPHPMAFAFTIEDAQAMGAPGRTKIYEMAQRGELILLRVAGRTLVSGDSLRELLQVSPAPVTPGKHR
jgi:hypothetical protein